MSATTNQSAASPQLPTCIGRCVGAFPRKAALLRALGLLASCACITASGSVYAFNAYALAVKKTYNITQIRVENMASMGNIGMCLAFPAGLIQEKFGAGLTIGSGAGLTAVAFVLLWMSTLTRVFHHTHFWLLYVYFFMAGFGSVFGYIAPLSVTIGNYYSHQRGFIIGVLDTCFSVGPAIFAAVYGLFFINGHHSDEHNQNLAGFFLFNGVVYLTIYTMGAFLVRPVVPDGESTPSQDEPTENLPLILQDRGRAQNGESIINQSQLTSGSSDQQQLFPQEDLTGWDLFRELDFQLLLWPVVFCTSLQLMFITNIPTYLKSFHNEKYNTIFTVMSPLVSVGMLLGYFSDITVERIPRVTYQFAINLCQTLFLFLCIWYVDSIPIFTFTVIIISIANSAAWCLTPAILSEYFGTKYFARNWGWSFIGLAVGGFVLQGMFGYLYDAHLVAGKRTCYGIQCFQSSFIVVTILSLLSVVCNAWSIERKVHVISEGWWRHYSPVQYDED